MRILAIDLATNLGVSLLHCPDTTPPNLKYQAMSVERARYGMQFDAYYDYISALLVDTKCDLVVYEDVKRHSSTAACHMFGFYRGALQQLCHAQAVPCIGIGVGTIKKAVSGKGNATKQEVAAAVFDWFGTNGVDYAPLLASNNRITDDVTDSMAVAITAYLSLTTDAYLIDAADKKNKFFMESPHHGCKKTTKKAKS